MVNEVKHRKELEHLRTEHESLQTILDSKLSSKIINQFEVQKIKKQRLEVKDKILELESMLVGDIVA